VVINGTSFGDFPINEEIEVINTLHIPTLTCSWVRHWTLCVGEGKLRSNEQAIFKVLKYKSFDHLIYSDDYGFENLIGQEELFVRGELPRRIKEALLQDERITDVEDIKMVFVKDTVTVHFTCVTIYGEISVTKDVSNIV
jgi:hypothetical protein